MANPGALQIQDRNHSNRSSAERIRNLIKDLKSEDWEVVESAAVSLSFLGPKAKVAGPFLIETLKHTQVRVRYHGATAIGRVGVLPPKHLPALIEALDDPSPGVRAAAALVETH